MGRQIDGFFAGQCVHERIRASGLQRRNRVRIEAVVKVEPMAARNRTTAAFRRIRVAGDLRIGCSPRVVRRASTGIQF